MTSARQLLEIGASGLERCLSEEGELLDPVFGVPTQYGTGYFAYVNAARATIAGDGTEREGLAESAERSLSRALRHLLDPDDRPAASGFSPDVASPVFLDHRDFLFPPVLRSLRLLAALGRPVEALASQVRRVVVPDAFSKRPPSNWAAVWMAGEQLRLADGLSPNPPAAMDGWLQPFFEQAIDLERGFYHEPGRPNSYDLFTRAHLLDLLEEGYRGRHRQALEQLLLAGTRRSLLVQLSSGSLASAHRSTGQLWTLTLQLCFLHRAARRLAGQHPELASAAMAGARRALEAAATCLRGDGSLSPVENVLPAGHRVGYERYTADAHYVSLALSFLATAVLEGFDRSGLPVDPLFGRRPALLVEGEPIQRALLHADGWSIHLNLDPQPGYDAFGIADLTAGPDSLARLGGQVRHEATGTPLALGIGVWSDGDSFGPLSALVPSGGRSLQGAGNKLAARALLDGLDYRISAAIDGDRLQVTEDLGAARCSLLVPYVRDRGDGRLGRVAFDGRSLRLAGGAHPLVLTPGRPVARMIHLTHGFQCRYGLAGLVRLDLEGAGPVAYEVRREP